MTVVPRRPLVAASMGVLLAVFAAACSSDKPKTESTPAAPAATQAVGATGSASPAAAPATALKWPGDPARQERAAKAVIPILGGIPNSPPRATPTPLPAGQTATPAPPAPTPNAPEKQQVVFYVDTVTSGAGESLVNVDPNISCVRTSAFARGMHVVFRMKLYDNTGTEIQTATADSVIVKIGGKDVTARYGRHGEAWFWTAAYDIPADAPLGVIDYSIVAKTKSGLTGTFKEIAVSNPATATESRLQVVG